MVLVWNSLSGGDNNLGAMLVGMNSILQILLYAVYASVFTNSIMPLLGFMANDSQACNKPHSKGCRPSTFLA